MSVYLCRTFGQATIAGTNSTPIYQNRFSHRPSGRYFDVRLSALMDSCLGMCLLIVARILEVRCASRTKDCPNTKQEIAAGPVTMIYLSFLPSCIMLICKPQFNKRWKPEGAKSEFTASCVAHHVHSESDASRITVYRKICGYRHNLCGDHSGTYQKQILKLTLACS